MTEAEERGAFYQAIIDDWDDDTPRLVYADWLDERGDPDRAEFIRLQIQLAHLPEGTTKEEQARLRQREEALLTAHQEAYTRDVPSWTDGLVFRRGLVAQVGASVTDFLRRGDELQNLAGLEAVRLRQEVKGLSYGQNQFVSYAGLNAFPVRGVLLAVAAERYQENLSISTTARNAYDAQLNLFPYAHCEVVLLGRYIKVGSQGQPAASLMMVQLHYYL